MISIGQGEGSFLFLSFIHSALFSPSAIVWVNC